MDWAAAAVNWATISWIIIICWVHRELLKVMKTNIIMAAGRMVFISRGLQIYMEIKEIFCVVMVTRVAPAGMDWSRDVAEMNIGADFKDALTEPGGWSIGATGFGEILPYHENKITLNKTVKDKWGLPVLTMDAGLKENELKMRKDIIKELVAMFEAAGVKNITTWDKDYNIGQGIHEMGSARMGTGSKNICAQWTEPGMGCKKCFCNRWCCHDVQCLPESVAYLYGINGEGRRFCSNGIEEGKYLKKFIVQSL